MTQPAKVQEPSMEEILASIRRIIADDEAKPAAAAGAKAEGPAKPVMKDIPPSAIAPAPKPAAPKPAPPPPAPEPAAASNNQDDIDAMLASLDAATPEADIRPALMTSSSPRQRHGSRPMSRLRSRASRRRYSRYCRARPSPPSSPPSTRWPIPCSATMRGRWKTWSRKCCGRC
jgi:cell pole-organizing protein PopZ